MLPICPSLLRQDTCWLPRSASFASQTSLTPAVPILVSNMEQVCALHLNKLHQGLYSLKCPLFFLPALTHATLVPPRLDLLYLNHLLKRKSHHFSLQWVIHWFKENLLFPISRMRSRIEPQRMNTKTLFLSAALPRGVEICQAFSDCPQMQASS